MGSQKSSLGIWKAGWTKRNYRQSQHSVEKSSMSNRKTKFAGFADRLNRFVDISDWNRRQPRCTGYYLIQNRSGMSERYYIDDLESYILVCPNQIFTYWPSPQSAEQPSLLPHFLIFKYTLQLFQTIIMRLLGKAHDLWAQYTPKSSWMLGGDNLGDPGTASHFFLQVRVEV